MKDPLRQLELASLIEEAKLSVRDVENVLRKRSARGRFFIKVRHGGNITVPPLLAERLRIEEGNVLEARIRHGKLALAVLHGANLLRLWAKSNQESECEANSDATGELDESG